MRKFDRFVVIAVFIAAAVLPGCSSDTDRSASMQPNSATSEELIAEGEHPELARLLGYPTGDDVLALGGKALKRLNHLNESGLTTDSDYRSVVDMLERVYNLMVWYENPEHAGTLPEDEADELEEIALNEYMGLAAGSTEQQAYDKVTEAVGGGLQQMVSLVNHVDFYAMIEYLVMAGPVSYTDTSKQTISSDSPLHTALTGISVNGFEGEDDARQTEDQFKETIAIENLSWPCFSELVGWGSPLAKAYAVRSTPSFFLISKEGIIVAKPTDAQELRKLLDELL